MFEAVKEGSEVRCYEKEKQRHEITLLR